MGWRDRVVPRLERFCGEVIEDGPAALALAIDKNGTELAKAGEPGNVDTSALAPKVAARLDAHRMIVEAGALLDVGDERQVHVRILGDRVILVVALVPRSRADHVADLLDQIDSALTALW